MLPGLVRNHGSMPTIPGPIHTGNVAAMQTACRTLADLNRAVVHVNQMLELPEPQRTRIIERTLAMGDESTIDVLRLYLSHLAEGLHDTPGAGPAVEHVRAFLLDACIIRHDVRGVRASDLYAAYSTWCEQRSITPLSQTAFGRAAGSLTPKRAMNRGIVYTMLALTPMETPGCLPAK